MLTWIAGIVGYFFVLWLVCRAFGWIKECDREMEEMMRRRNDEQH